MPKIGEIKRGVDIGYKSYCKYIWSSCEICGQERWVQRHKINPRCIRCTWLGRRHSIESKIKMSEARRGKYTKSYCPSWNGGRIRSSGYIAVRMYPDDFFYPMADKKHYLMEHRLVIAKHLGRCLQLFEIVHHKNGNKRDNRLENLELATRGTHYHRCHNGYKVGYRKGLVDGKDEQIKILRERIKELETR